MSLGTALERASSAPLLAARRTCEQWERDPLRDVASDRHNRLIARRGFGQLRDRVVPEVMEAQPKSLRTLADSCGVSLWAAHSACHSDLEGIFQG